MSRGWLTQRYGQATFMGRWGAALALLAAVPVLLLICQSRGLNPHTAAGMPPISLACLALLGTGLACVAILRTLGGPRISLGEAWLLTQKAGLWAWVWIQSPVWDLQWNDSFCLRWGWMCAGLILGVYAAAASLHRLRTPIPSGTFPLARWWTLWLLPHALHAAVLGAALVWLKAGEVQRALLSGAVGVAILYGVFRQQRPPAPTPASEPLRSRAPIRPEARRRSVSAEPIQGGAASGRRRA